MTISTVPEQLGMRSPSGVVAPGLHKDVIASGGTTRTLLPSESGAVCLFDSAAGITYTLPTPVVGMHFDFFWTKQRTSSSHKIVTAAVATQFMVGSLMAGDATIATSGDVFEADGTTIAAVTIDGDTKGGFIGGRCTLVAISATQWAIHGIVIGTGTMATPFTTT